MGCGIQTMVVDQRNIGGLPSLMSSFLFSSESVTEGHPDKICDQIADGVLDIVLAQDPKSRVACEVATKTGYVLVFGELTTQAHVNVVQVVRDTLKRIGYDDSEKGMDFKSCAVFSTLEQQSPDIARGVEGQGIYNEAEQGAGDQGMMFGYACTDTPERMPLPIALAHRLTKRLATERKAGLPFLRPDGKAQVTVRYDGNQPVGIDAIVLSSQHSPDVSHKMLQEALMEQVIKTEIPESLRKETKYYINPTGRFVLGGPAADSGLTGRKIIVDTYGGWSRHGGGSFSGKDPSKVDRSAAYYARYIAKNLVNAGLATHCEVQLAYAIGVAKPVSVFVSTFGTGRLPDEMLQNIVLQHFDCRPAAIIEELDLVRPLYQPTASYGHFGRAAESFTWEQTPKATFLSNYTQ